MGRREEERRRRSGRKPGESIMPYSMQKLLKRNYKAVYASEDILSLYHSSLLYGEVPFTSRLRAMLTSGPISLAVTAVSPLPPVL
ncbi:unnamed protein product [Closterium sp. Yama58-4]|nr:unnamed protein product [Closterium sp. Yama58-4]